MSTSLLSQSARNYLYEDSQLGAGNFFFKTYELCKTRDVPFLFLEKPFRTPYGDEYDELSMRQLLQAVMDLAHWYRAHNIKRGAYVCTYTEEGCSPFLHFLALNSIGAIPVPINSQMPTSIAARYARANGFGYFVHDGNINFDESIAEELRDIQVLNSATTFSARPETMPTDWPLEKAEDDTVMICHSSGTTGIPKAVIFSHTQFFNGKRERLRNFIETDNERMLTAFPQSHSAGISYLMTATMLGLPTKILSTLTGSTVAAQIQAFQPTVLVAFPQTYLSLISQGLPSGAFGTVRRMINTGDSAHEAHIRQLLALAPDARFFDGFGASELGMSCFWKVSAANAVTSRRCVGQPAPYASARVLDALGNELPAGETGYLAIKSPTVTPGYYNAPHLTEMCRLGQHWLTGDVGYFDPEGNFYHQDRAVDVIATAAGPAYSLPLEELIQQLPAVHDAHVIGVGRLPTREHSLIALVVPHAGANADPQAVLEILLQQPALAVLRGRGYAIGVCLAGAGFKAPTGATGKVLKRALRETFWDTYRAYCHGEREVFTSVLWNHAPTGAR